MFKNECSRNCWLAAVVVGLLVWLFNATIVGGFVLGLITFVLLGNLLIFLVCNGRGGAAEDAQVVPGHATASVASGDSVLDRAEQAVVDASNAFAAGTVAAVAKGREALHDIREEARKADEDHDDRAGHRDDEDHDDDDDDDDDDDSILERAEERLEKAGEAVKDAMGALAARGKDAITALKARGEDADQPAEAPPPELAARVSPSGQSAVPTDPAGAKPRSEAAKPAVAGQAEPADKPKPARAKAPKAKVEAQKPDDLKEIKGVGPALEAMLHENGVTSFTQIARWTDADIDHYAELIGRMGGRIRSDDWVAQAKVLADGGDTEFSRRVDKGEVY